MAQRGHQTIAGPSSPPKAPRSQQQQSRQPRRAEEATTVDYSGYGYGNNSEFGAKRPGEAAGRQRLNGTSFSNGRPTAYANMANGLAYGHQQYARSAPLPPAGAPLHFQHGFPATPPTAPRSAKQDSSRLQVLPGTNNLYTANASSSTSAPGHAPRGSIMEHSPPVSSSKYHYSPPPLPPSSGNSVASTSRSTRPPPPPPPHSALPPPPPSAPRAMLNTYSNPLKGKGSSTPSIISNVSKSSQSSDTTVNGLSKGTSSIPKVEDLARAALAKAKVESTTTQSNTVKPTINGQPQARKTVMSISINSAPSRKIAYPVRAIKGQLGTSKAKSVNVFEALEKKEKQEREREEQEEAVANTAKEVEVKTEDLNSSEKDSTSNDAVVLGPRYTPPPRDRVMYRPEARPTDSKGDNLKHSSPSAISSTERSHTPPPRPQRTQSRHHTPPPRHTLPPRPPLHESRSPPPPPPSLTIPSPPPPSIESTGNVRLPSPPPPPSSSTPPVHVKQEAFHHELPTREHDQPSLKAKSTHISIALPLRVRVKAEEVTPNKLLVEPEALEDKDAKGASDEVVSSVIPSKPASPEQPDLPTLPPKEPNWYKLDNGSSKASRPPVIRYAGKGMERPPKDPRQSESQYDARLSALKYNKQSQFRNKISAVEYQFDEYSCGRPPPPPASAVMVAGLTPLTSIEKVRAHFASYGVIEEADLKVDDRTGGSLGICWIKYNDGISRTVYTKEGKSQQRGSPDGQDGHACALLAVQRSHGIKHATLCGNQGKLHVILDGQGDICKKWVKVVLDRKRGKIPPPPRIQKKPEQEAQSTEIDVKLVPHVSLPVRPVALPDSESTRKLLPTEPPSSRRDPETRASRPSYGDRTPPRTSPQRRPPPMISPARAAPAAREPYRLPPSASRSRRDDSRDRFNSSRRRVRPQSDTDSASDSDNDSEEAVNRRLRDDDRVYGPGSRQSRRLPPPNPALAAAPQIRREYRTRIDVLQRLANQKYPYIVVNKVELAEFPARGVRLSVEMIRGHLAGRKPEAVFEDADRYYATFTSKSGAINAYYLCAEKTTAGLLVPVRLENTPPTSEMIEAIVKEAEDDARQRAKAAAAAQAEARARRNDTVQSARPAVIPAKVPPVPTARDILLEARAIIIRDLRQAFHDDLRGRLAPAQIVTGWKQHESRQIQNVRPVAGYDSPSKTRPTSPIKEKEKENDDMLSKDLEGTPHILKSAQDMLSTSLVDVDDAGESAKLPSFSRQAERNRLKAGRAEHNRKDTPELSQHSNLLALSDDAMDLSSDAPSKTAHLPPSNSTQPPLEKQGSPLLASKGVHNMRRKSSTKPRAGKKSKTPRLVEQLYFTSSDEDEGVEDEGVEDDSAVQKITSKPSEDFENAEPSLISVNADLKPATVESTEVVHIIPLQEADELAPLEANITLPTPAPTESSTSSTKRELSESTDEPAKRARLESHTPPQTATPVIPALSESTTATKNVKAAAKKAPVRGKGKGRKNIKQKKKASETPPPQVSRLSNLVDDLDQEDMFYLKIALARHRAGQAVLPEEPVAEEEEGGEELEIVEPRHETGCARTEGYYKIPQQEKLRYLLARNQAKEEPAKESNSSLSVSRLARVNARHLASGLDKHKKATATDTDLLQLNQLRTRKKQLRFARSPIHDWGLYALEYIPAGEMVIEYVGEQIRQQVADKREKGYERQGIGSSYLFRVDDDVVIDATMKGNLGRLINHCCTPNCTAKILSVGNSKKIVIYAKQVINKGDEITYDYHFPIEDEKIVCLCGSSGCRGFLN